MPNLLIPCSGPGTRSVGYAKFHKALARIGECSVLDHFINSFEDIDKIYITLFALFALIIAGGINYRTYHLPCPVDPALGATCMAQRKRSRYLYYASTAVFLFATIFTHIIPRII